MNQVKAIQWLWDYLTALRHADGYLHLHNISAPDEYDQIRVSEFIREVTFVFQDELGVLYQRGEDVMRRSVDWIARHYFNGVILPVPEEVTT